MKINIDTDKIKDNAKAKRNEIKKIRQMNKTQRLMEKANKNRIKSINKLEENLMAAGMTFVEARNVSNNIINKSSQNITF